MPRPANGTTLLSALTDFSFSQFATVRLIPILYILGLIAGAVMASAYLLTALRLGVIVGLVALVLIPLGFLVFALYLRVLLELVMVLFRIEQGVARMAGPSAPEI